ncbi:hypothetical protein Acid345_4346 [Candidatus Koribacter versatilis Ellin345]|uniref:Uncharacterized protein n=1 Tax=Koribacter versatilis (strain Ellin345) TaxID=204669 RepID=Q1IIF4_KORVE|nr:hypothetical protein [Candidatus Koribacter versatilis]ABF43346.1 hypothetical protein Acid345_4346 [Candidatus Koribacter versatilis Ellin345]
MNSDCKFYVFREGRRTVPGEQLLTGLRGSLFRAKDEDSWTDAMLRCGELECALEDAGDPQARHVAAVSNACADKLVHRDYFGGRELGGWLPVRLEGEVTVATPEGFAYYALHPRQYADVAAKFGVFRHGAKTHEAAPEVVVIGIRSIGTTLSAMTTAALRLRGLHVERFTVRPAGHPFDRKVKFNPAQSHTIRTARLQDALFVIVDEGPGLSGSSFLSVAEALVAERVPSGQIVLVPNHAPHLPWLRANNAAVRWQRYRTVTPAAGRSPEGEWIGGGEWRKKTFANESEWPGVWTSMERAKFADDRVLWKFEGIGPYGARARSTARALADAGFAPNAVRDEHGYVGYDLIRGRAAKAQDLSDERLKRIAEYCAFRSEECKTEVTEAQQKDLATMLRVNYERGFDRKLAPQFRNLPVERPTVCDGKMSPHEWLLTEDGRMLKLDATSHGDDHFFPGPCDVAWDLAGAIVEWGMDRATGEQFLRQYTALTGDNVTGRMRNYLLAYAMFRMAWTHMAAAAMKGTAEATRLMRDSDHYREYVSGLVMGAAKAVPVARAS